MMNRSLAAQHAAEYRQNHEKAAKPAEEKSNTAASPSSEFVPATVTRGTY
jgi:hypothetical protein